MPVQYVVVRREGAVPAGRPDEGTVVKTTAQAQCLDDGADPGRRYSYAVFARAAERHSRTAATAPPVDVLAEVTDLRAATGDGTVELSWTPPANVGTVVVRRGVEEPRDHTAGTLVRLSGAGHAKDEKLGNGIRYHYLVCCGYRPDGAAEVFSAGVRIAAVPDHLPDAVADFAARAVGSEIFCTWSAPAYGQVVVLRSPRSPDLPPGRRLNADSLDRLGQRVPTSGDGRAVDPQPDRNQPYYSAFSVAGGHAVAGGTRPCVACPDVTELKPAATGAAVILRWAWPAACTAVRVVRREGAWPDGPDDPQAARLSCTLTEYRDGGEKFVDNLGPVCGRFHYVVYAQPAGVPGVWFAPGAGPDCRAVVQYEPWMTVRYDLEGPEDPGARGKELLLLFQLEQPFAGFAGLVLVANQERPPADVGDGVELLRWEPKEGSATLRYKSAVSLAAVRQRRWARFYCKLLAADPAQRHAVLVVHPDVSQPFSESGERPAPRGDGRPRTYTHGVPRTVVCPTCFEVFSPRRMLYSDFSGGEPRPARRGWLDRLLGRPPRPPRNAQGQVLARKLCPNRHVMPFTAGSQASLVIGLIGAKYSGKSHYVAALVQQLEGQTGNDLQAHLLPVTDETPERYRREFYDPLFKNRLELGLTVGAPPPLIYDLTFDGRQWGDRDNRSVTLALYDTAGENFDNRATVQQMVRYLGVASGVMLLVDPLQLRAVREALPVGLRLPEVEDPGAIIGRVLLELESGRVLHENAPLSTPVAVVLTKCDVLRDAGLIEPNRLWCTQARHVGRFDRELHDDTSGMMAEYVQRWSPAVYQTVARRFAHFAFFGVSATGCASDSNTRRYKYISPWRVEDPLLWLLAEVGVIPSR
jgi:hypothetical protein